MKRGWSAPWGLKVRWFKHFSDMHRGRSINALMDEHGHMGLCFFLLQEMCAEKLEKPDEGEPELSESDCVFSFHQRVVTQNLRVRPAALHRLLNSCQTSGLLSYKIDGNQIEIAMPILLNLLDRDSKRARHTRAKNAAPNGIDIEEDKDTDKEEESTSAVVEKTTPTPSEPDFKASSVDELMSSIPAKKYVAWSELYGGDEQFIFREIRKAFEWYSDNPKKIPKSKRGWLTALSAWLERGWTYRAKQTPGAKADKAIFKNSHLLKLLDEPGSGT